jgi:hypothetical protein
MTGKYKVGDQVVVNANTGTVGLAGTPGVIDSVLATHYCISVGQWRYYLLEEGSLDPVPGRAVNHVARMNQAVAAMQAFTDRCSIASIGEYRLCECGSESVGSPMHSSWCPKYS